MSSNAQNVMTPLLVDSRLTLPTIESSKIAMVPPSMAYVGRTTSPMAAVGNAGMAALRGLGTAAKATAMAPVKAVGGAVKLPGHIVNHMVGNPAVGAADAPGVAGAMSRMTVGQGAGLGAALGAAKGAIDPGTSTDDNGNQVQNSRLMSMAGGAATGGLLGGVAAPLSRMAAPHVAKIPSMAGGKEMPTGKPTVSVGSGISPISSFKQNETLAHVNPAQPPVAGATRDPHAMEGMFPPHISGEGHTAVVAPPGSAGRFDPQTGKVSHVMHVTLGLPTLPSSKRADRIIKHLGSPGPRGGSTDACLNRASEGPACTNTDAVTSTSKMASTDSPETGATYNKAQGTAPLSGPADMKKGPDGAKAETADHAKRVALAKQETDGSTSLHTAPTKTPAVTAVDREKAVQQFPVLSLRK